MVCDVSCDFNPFLSRQVHVIIDSAMLEVANSRATTRNSIAIVLHAGCTAAASSVKCLRKKVIQDCELIVKFSFGHVYSTS